MKKSFPKIIFLSVVLISFSFFVKGQDSSAVKFFDVVKNDSVVMYFNSSFNFTEKRCANFVRHTKIDSFGDFYQSFTDSSTDHKILGKGFYSEGLKNGEFETYHPNGIQKSKGFFKANKPSGYWNCYYPDGSLEKQILFNVADTLLIEFYDNAGNQLVKGGNGFFKGFVGSAIDKFYQTVLFAEGNIVNGKPNGEWKAEMSGYSYCTEKFMAGRFISGKMPKTIIREEKMYSDFSFLDIIYQPAYIYRLETYKISKCFDFISKVESNEKKPKANQEFDINNVRSFITDAVNQIIENDIRRGNYDEYQIGDNLFKIRFKINEKGSPVDFKKVTSWGDQYYDAVTRALSMHAKLPSSSQLHYFSITITRNASNIINYHYRFSND